MHFEVLHSGLFGRSDVIALDTVHRVGLWGPCFTHHRPHNNHPRYAADTSTAGVLRFLEAEDLEPYAACTLTTNHFDADAFLPVWAWLHPRSALEHAARLRRIARSGDFFLELDEISLLLALALESFHHRMRGHGMSGERHVEDELTRRCFAELLPVFEGWLEAPARAAALWREPLGNYYRDREALEGRVTELWHAHTSLVVLDRPVSAYALNTACRNDLFLIRRADTGAWTLQARPALAWYELPSMPHQPSYELGSLARALGWSCDTGAARIWTESTALEEAEILGQVERWLAELPLSPAYRRDVAEVFGTWSSPAVGASDERFQGRTGVEFRPDAPYGGLFPATPTSFRVSDDFYWNEKTTAPLSLTLELAPAEGSAAAAEGLEVEYDGWASPFQRAERLAEVGGNIARFLLREPRLAASQPAGADFRLLSKTPLSIQRLELCR